MNCRAFTKRTIQLVKTLKTSHQNGRKLSTKNTLSKTPSRLPYIFAGLTISATALYLTNPSEAQPVDRFAGTLFYPEIKPYHEDMLKVSHIHTIHYSEYGNPKGKPVLFVHGGPGGGTDANMARYFDPKVYRIILVDQRGCGKSIPFANLEENTTFDLVADFEKLRIKLGNFSRDFIYF